MQTKQLQGRHEKLMKEVDKIRQKSEMKERKLIKQFKSENQHILSKVDAQLQMKDQQITRLQAQIQSITQSFNQLKQDYQNLIQQNSQKTLELDEKTRQNQQLQRKISQMIQYHERSKIELQKVLFSHQQQMDKSFAKQKTLSNTVKKLQQQVDQQMSEKNQFQQIIGKKQNAQNFKLVQMQNQLRKSNRLVDKLKKELKQSDSNYDTLKKQISKFRQKYKKFQMQYNQMKIVNEKEIAIKQQAILKHINEISSLKQKIKSLVQNDQRSRSKGLKLKGNFQKYLRRISDQVSKVKSQNSLLKQHLKQRFNTIKQYSETTVTKIVNCISVQLSQRFQECVFQIKKAREQKHLAKNQARVKSQIIQHLDKMLNSQVKSVNDLRTQLQQKMKEQEKLRKKLKSEYQFADKKMEDFQNRYISYLRNQF